MKHTLTVTALAVCLLLGNRSAYAQIAEPTGVQEPAEPKEAEESEEGEPRFEAELIASTLFQGGTVAARLRSPLTFESHFFGVEDNEIGMVGLAWTFSRGGLRVIPGVGWSFGSENRPAPVITARWSYEHRRWLTQGLWVQSLKAYVPPEVGHGEEPAAHEESARRASTLDGVHLSARIGRAEVGGLVEHIVYREAEEWKGGARVAWRFDSGFKVVSQVVGPGVEARAGFVWER
jgi:hypothetical protein